MRMTREPGWSSFVACSTLRPSALGRRMSVMTQSKASILRAWIACSPSGTTVTAWPAPFRASPRVTAMVRSSSASRIFIEDPSEEVASGIRLRGRAGGAPHHVEPRGAFEQLEDLIVEHVQGPRLDGAAVLQHVVGVALLLAGDRGEDDHGELLGQALRDGEAARLRDDEVALAHQFVDVVDEAVDDGAAGGDLLELLAHRLVLARDDRQLEGHVDREDALEGLLHMAHAEAAAHEEDRRLVGRGPGRVEREDRVDRDAGRVDLLGRIAV